MGTIKTGDIEPYRLEARAVLAALDVSPPGLSAAQAQERLAHFGPNRLIPPKKISPRAILLRQFKNLLIVILIAATLISFFLGERLDAYVILAIILACVFLGFIQEYRAEEAAVALQKLAAPAATVLRDGKEEVIEAAEVAPGDILVLAAGDRVAADGRLLEAIDLKIDEALLTGESIPVHKTTAPDPRPHLAIADQKNMVFGGTVVTYGRGQAVVTATGMDSEFGRIARFLGEMPQGKTPLEKRMATIGKALTVICLGISAGATLFGILKGNHWLAMLIWGISLAVAAVPEALPAVVTGALAIGTTRMARRRAIVKRLPAVEAMGCTTVICTDKTGTLTKNEMTVRRLYMDGRKLEVSGLGYEPYGIFSQNGQEVLPGQDQVLQVTSRLGLLCNDARLIQATTGWTIQGDPTEGALVVMASKGGLEAAILAQEYPRVAEVPFSSERRRMTTLHKSPGGILVCTKGSPEGLLSRCSRILTGGGERVLSEAERRQILAEAAQMAATALRVLGLAYRELKTIPQPLSEEVETDLVWVALVGMIDPPRPEAYESVAQCRQAGIRVIMVTGDHPHTALAIAQELGLAPLSPDNSPVLTGAELTRMSDDELRAALIRTPVFARVVPEHKLRLVDLLKQQGQVVAMTGDGVNDAPGLKLADIGVAMGLTGTEVTKETADIILADDNFATLVAAVEEGRAIFDNIKKYLIFLLSCNLSEILMLTGAFFLGMPIPLVALQILWVNLTTDGLPALALGVDPKAPDIMQRPPRPPQEGVFIPQAIILMTVITVYKTAALIILFYYYQSSTAVSGLAGLTLARAQTMVFVTLILAELVNAFNCRSERHSLFKVGPLANRWLVAAVLLSLAMMVAVVQLPPLAKLFHTVPLSWHDWLVAGGTALLLLPVVELAKWWLRRCQLAESQVAQSC